MEYLGAISGLLAAVVIPVVIAVVGQAYTRAIREREIQGRLVELAIGILKEKPNEENRELRRWAVDVVDRFSGVKFLKKARTDLIERIPFPVQLTSYEYRAMARQLKSEKRFEEAIHAYLTAFDLEPNDPSPLNFAGAILSKYLGDFDEAEKMYDRALEVNQDFVSPIYNKACNEVRRHNYRRALDYLEEAIDKDPKYRQLAGRDPVFKDIVGEEERKRFGELLQ